MKHYPRRLKLLKDFRGPGRCEHCKQMCRNREAAHILSKGMGGAHPIDDSYNLVALGGPFDCGCHVLHHAGKEPTAKTLWAIVDTREGLKPGTAEATINAIRRSD